MAFLFNLRFILSSILFPIWLFFLPPEDGTPRSEFTQAFIHISPQMIHPSIHAFDSPRSLNPQIHILWSFLVKV